MGINYIDNIYQTRKNAAAVKLQGLQTWLLAHDVNLQAERASLTKLHEELVKITKTALQDRCSDLSVYAPYTALADKIKIAENTFERDLAIACENYCQQHNYVVYQCLLCHDQGYITQIENAEKRSINCPRCYPQLCQNYLKSLHLWQINYSYQDEYSLDQPSFAIYKAKNPENLFAEQIHNYETNYKFCCYFADAIISETRGQNSELLQERRNLLISGAAGSGKSYLAAKIADYVLKKGVLAIFVTADKLAELYRQQALLQSSYTPDLRQADYIRTCFNLLAQAKILVIDDLAISNLQIAHLLDLFNHLQEHQHLVLTTNLSADDIVKTYGERIFSRLFYKTESIVFNTADLRLEL